MWGNSKQTSFSAGLNSCGALGKKLLLFLMARKTQFLSEYRPQESHLSFETPVNQSAKGHICCWVELSFCR